MRYLFLFCILPEYIKAQERVEQFGLKLMLELEFKYTLRLDPQVKICE
jgi:hypothetical protein